MAITVEDANTYISANCIDIDDWTDAGEAKQLRIINVAARDLAQFYPKYTIPDAAVYEFANVLATVYGDSVRLAQQGVSGFSLNGVASFNYKDSAINVPGGSTRKYIPQIALDLIGAENGVVISKRGAKWVTM
jgi:hypothetical protein